MKKTAEERAEISRRNGRKSKGPITPAGRAASARNSTKHGMRARTLVMAHEDPEVVAARVDAWNTHYQPQTPAALHLINQCVAATLLSDRCQIAHDSALADQVDHAAQDWDAARAAEVAEAWKGLSHDPAGTVAALEQTGHGCRWLSSRWERLGMRLKLRGYWERAECDEAVRLSGVRPTLEGLRDDLTAYMLVLSHLRCRPEPSEDEVATMLAPVNRPGELADREPSTFVFGRERCVELLGNLVLEMIDLVGASERRVESSDTSSRTRAMNRALVLKDEKDARLFFRYHSESRSTFHRAYKDLVATLERDAAEHADGGVFDSPIEPDSRDGGGETLLEDVMGEASAVASEEAIPPIEPSTPVYPNEPTEEVKKSIEPRETTKTSGENPVRPKVATTAVAGAEGGDAARFTELERSVLERYPTLRDQWLKGKEGPPVSG